MKLQIFAASAFCLLLGDIPSAFGIEDDLTNHERGKTTNTNLRSKERMLARQEQEDLWRLILNDQTSFIPTPAPIRSFVPPTRRPTAEPTRRPTFSPTTLPPVLPQDEQCQLDVSNQAFVFLSYSNLHLNYYCNAIDEYKLCCARWKIEGCMQRR